MGFASGGYFSDYISSAGIGYWQGAIAFYPCAVNIKVSF
jgi:hypothetical protein